MTHLKLKELQQPEVSANKVTAALLFIYLMILLWILLFKLGVQFSYMEERRVSLVPFYHHFVTGGKLDISETIFNIIAFVPLGVYSGILFRGWGLYKKGFLFFMISVIIEVLQYVFKIGAFDSTDVVTNTLGGFVGLLLIYIPFKIFNNKSKVQTYINFIAVSGTALIIILLALLKLDMLPIRYQ